MAKYRHIRRIATGGMGTVELVVREEREFRRVYAMKRLRPELRGQPDVEAMFRSEAKIAGLLHHPNVVSVIDVGEDEEGPYLVMDFVRGLSLSRLLEHLGQAGERIPQGVALSIFLDVANGLQAAHELRDLHGRPLGLVHRDVSPQNVLIGFDGVARLADFGIAKAAAHGDRTTTGLLKGKVGYFAPEQLRFESPTPQTDLYAFGVALFECLAGRRFYSSKVAEEIARSVLHDPPPDLYEERRDAHPALVELLFRLLAKSPSKRPSSAASVATALRDIAQDLGETEPTPTLREFLEGRFPQERARVEELLSSTHGHRPRRVRSWVMAGVLLVAAAGGVAFLAGREPSASETAPVVPTREPPRTETPVAAPRVEPVQAPEPRAMQPRPRRARPSRGRMRTPTKMTLVPATMTEMTPTMAAMEPSEFMPWDG